MLGRIMASPVVCAHCRERILNISAHISDLRGKRRISGLDNEEEFKGNVVSLYLPIINGLS